MKKVKRNYYQVSIVGIAVLIIVSMVVMFFEDMGPSAVSGIRLIRGDDKDYYFPDGRKLIGDTKSVCVRIQDDAGCVFFMFDRREYRAYQICEKEPDDPNLIVVHEGPSYNRDRVSMVRKGVIVDEQKWESMPREK